MSRRPKLSRPTLDDVFAHAARIGAGGHTPGKFDDRRDHGRHPYRREVPVLWLGAVNKQGEVATLRASDIAVGGIRLISRHMLYPGARGVIQLSRGENEHALVGIEVVYTDYIGDMRYASGCRFVPVPHDVMASRFARSDGGATMLRTTARSAPPQRGAA